MPRTTPDREARAAAIVQCLNAPETQLAMSLANNTVPSNSAAADELAKQQPEMASIVETVRSARALTSDAGDKWPVVDIALSEAIQAVITGQASVAGRHGGCAGAVRQGLRSDGAVSSISKAGAGPGTHRRAPGPTAAAATHAERASRRAARTAATAGPSGSSSAPAVVYLLAVLRGAR